MRLLSMRASWYADTAGHIGGSDRRHPSHAKQPAAVDGGHWSNQPDQEPASATEISCSAGGSCCAWPSPVMHYACHVSHGRQVRKHIAYVAQPCLLAVLPHRRLAEGKMVMNFHAAMARGFLAAAQYRLTLCWILSKAHTLCGVLERVGPALSLT